IIILVAVIAVNFTKVMLTSRYFFVYEHFNAGDNVYIKSGFFRTDTSTFTLARLIRAQTERDIDSLNLSAEDKAELKLKINPTLQPYLIGTHDIIAVAKKTPLVGSYIKHETLYMVNKKTHKKVPVIFYAVHPTEQVLKIDSYYLKYPDLPTGYTWADNTYYINPNWLSNSPK
ncbi:hypothetical protein, partial [Mucilaginibacter polytrichastri]